MAKVRKSGKEAGSTSDVRGDGVRSWCDRPVGCLWRVHSRPMWPCL